MLRAIWLTVQNEARLLVKDPIVLFMLLLAPVVIIAVAGYSLGSLYGDVANSVRVPVVDLDHGLVAQAIIRALSSEPSIKLEFVSKPEQARQLVSYRDRTPIAIEIPAGTSIAVQQGGKPRLVLFVDPVRRIEVNALELRISELCRKITEREQAEAQARLDLAERELRDEIKQLAAAIELEQSRARSQIQQTETDLERSIRAQMAAALKQAREQAEALMRARESSAWNDVQNQLSERQAILIDLRNYLTRLQSSQRAFEDWFATLKASAGNHAREIPPPPSFPAPPSLAELAQIAKPITPPKYDEVFSIAPPDAITITIPQTRASQYGGLPRVSERIGSALARMLPGNLGFSEWPALDSEAIVVNAFDQYVPGFGVTFLMIGMMLGIALTLFDERDWGTLKRLQVSGVPLTGLLIGKVVARFIVGMVQMVLLFAVGRVLFGISLGRQPIALLIPIVGISFAASALGLVIASIARAHDSVMPLGTVVSMAMAAIGGCWWPLDFEPGWMRSFASWLPTTWTMEAFNNLTIRNLPASSTLWPFAATVGLGAIFLTAGILRLIYLED
jgi:ABC-type multidrug transport system permease subunit